MTCRISGPVARARAVIGQRRFLCRQHAARAARDRRDDRLQLVDARAQEFQPGNRRAAVVPLPRAMLLRKLLSENSAKVSSRISRTMASKSSRVSLRRSGSVMISKRRGLLPGQPQLGLDCAGVESRRPAPAGGAGAAARSASSGRSSISRSAASASGASRSSKR